MICYLQLQRKERQKENLINIKKNLEMKCRTEKAKRANKRREEARIRRDILNCADVICTTLSGAGSASLKQDLAGRLELLYSNMFSCTRVIC